MIREKPVELAVGKVIEETSEIKTWGCCAQGTSSISAMFNKNVFTPQEHAEGQIKMNNEACKIGVKKVRFSVE